MPISITNIYGLINRLINKHGQKVIFVIWSFTVAGLLFFKGVNTGGESFKYIQEAERLYRHQGLSAARFIFYFPTIFIVYLSLLLHIGIYGAFILQALLNFFATLYFYKSMHRFFKNPVYPFAISFLLISFLPYSNWVIYLYTESVFFSSILLLLSSLINYCQNKNNKNGFLIFITLILVTVSRPLGILFILPTLLYFFVQGSKKEKIFLASISIIVFTILVAVSNIIFSTTADTTITLAATQQCIVCGIIPDNPHPLQLTIDGSPVYQLLYYLTHNYSHFIQLSVVKLRYFFLMTRSYYSLSHNIFLLIIVVPIYLFCIKHILSKKEAIWKGLYYFEVSSITLFAIVIMLQCDDYENRFVMALFPVFLLMAAKGIEKFLLARKNK